MDASLNPTVPCRCGHERGDHMYGSSKCDLCGCSAFEELDFLPDVPGGPRAPVSRLDLPRTWQAGYEAGWKDHIADAAFRARLTKHEERVEEAKAFGLEDHLPPFTDDPPTPTPNPHL